MSETGDSVVSNPAPDGSDGVNSSARIVRGLIVSVMLHALLVCIMLFSGFRGLGTVGAGEDEADVRDVGIYLKQPSPQSTDQPKPSDANASSTDATPAQSASSPAHVTAVPDRPPVDIRLPRQTPKRSVIGLSPGGSLTPAPDLDALIRAAGRLPATRPAQRGAGETSFFNIRDKGQSFAYVLDASGSMYGAPLRAAKAELRASLHGLSTKQRFQVIFYNEVVHEMTLPRQPNKTTYPATSINKNRAGAYIDGIVADGGTDHLPALKRALAQSPEVLFFLTDADSRLSAADLNDIRRQYNKGRTRIHCIEFGKGPRLQNAPDNFLQKLARQNRGKYRYRDVTGFSR